MGVCAADVGKKFLGVAPLNVHPQRFARLQRVKSVRKRAVNQGNLSGADGAAYAGVFDVQTAGTDVIERGIAMAGQLRHIAVIPKIVFRRAVVMPAACNIIK